MELQDRIMKFPPYWRGVFAPLSKNHHAIMGANSWLLENREGALTCPGMSRSRSCRGSQIDWMGFVDGLCEEEPAEIRSRLVFLPRILLFPVNIQRNTLAFLSEHLAEIPTKCLVNLLESLRNHQPFPDEWVRHHLRTMQDFVCRKRCQNYGSGFRADDHRSKLTKASWDGFSNVCRLIRDKDRTRDGGNAHKLQFDWLPEAFTTNQRACQHGTYFASEMIASPVQRKSSPETLQNNHVEETKKTPESPSKKQKTDVSSPSEIIVITESLPSSPMQVCLVTEEKVAGISEIGRNGAKASVGGQTASTEVASGGQEDAKEGVAGDGASDEDGLKDNRSDVIDAVTMDTLTAMKSSLSSPAGGSIPTDHLRLLIDCPTHQMEAYCDVLELDSVSAAGLSTLTHQLAGFSLELSHLSAVILAKRCFNKQVQNLTQTAPRSLITAIVSISKTFPKPTIDGALLPSLTEEGHVGVATHQCDLVAKVVKEALTNESRVYLLSKILSVKTLHWSEELTVLIQTIVGCKLELDNQTLEIFVAALEHHGTSQNSCAKFAKLLLAVVNRFSKQFSATSLVPLQRLADANQTFLKKALVAALKRVKG